MSPIRGQGPLLPCQAQAGATYRIAVDGFHYSDEPGPVEAGSCSA